MVQEHRGEYASLWAAIESIAPKVGCVPQTLSGNRCNAFWHLYATHLSPVQRAGDWEAWLTAARRKSLHPASFLRFDHFHVSLQAIVYGLGIDIGTLPTLSRDLAQGRLTLPFPELRVAGADYAALIPAAADGSCQLHEFLAWLTAAAAESFSA